MGVIQFMSIEYKRGGLNIGDIYWQRGKGVSKPKNYVDVVLE